MAILPRKIASLKTKRKGFTLIEVMIVVAIISIMILIGIWAYRLQLLKGRDARRKADLAQWQKMLEDYINDNVCYPPGLACGPVAPGGSFEGYLSEIPCDPINNTWYNYLYTFGTTEDCKKWYKIYTKLENEKDSIITQVGCDSNEDCPGGGCGPSCNYNYWVGSANVTEVVQLPGEFWPEIPGASPPPGGTPTSPLPPGSTPSPSLSPEVSLTPSFPPSPDGSPPPETEPTNCWDSNYETFYCIFDGICSTCCPDTGPYRCEKMDLEDPYDDVCVLDPVCQ